MLNILSSHSLGEMYHCRSLMINHTHSQQRCYKLPGRTTAHRCRLLCKRVYGNRDLWAAFRRAQPSASQRVYGAAYGADTVIKEAQAIAAVPNASSDHLKCTL